MSPRPLQRPLRCLLLIIGNLSVPNATPTDFHEPAAHREACARCKRIAGMVAEAQGPPSPKLHTACDTGCLAVHCSNCMFTDTPSRSQARRRSCCCKLLSPNTSLPRNEGRRAEGIFQFMPEMSWLHDKLISIIVPEPEENLTNKGPRGM